MDNMQIPVPAIAMSKAIDKLLCPMVKRILEFPLGYQWTVQGMGMMRMYFGDELRLNIWHSSLRLNPVPTLIHDHPWDFQSMVLGGRLVNTRYTMVDRRDIEEGIIHENAIRVRTQTIRPGEGLQYLSDPTETLLVPMPIEQYHRGNVYAQTANEIHETEFDDTTVTLIFRARRGLKDQARTFWYADDVWRSAEPRTATTEEVLRVTQEAIKEL